MRKRNAYVEQQPHHLRFAVEGGLVQTRPGFGASVDVDAGFEQQPEMSKQETLRKRLQASLKNIHSTVTSAARH